MKRLIPLLALVSIVLISAHTPREHKATTSSPKDVLESIRTDLADYLWPTDAGHIITSSFAEFRSSHFHAGIDISTGDVTGFKVFAARDGYVSRVRVSPVGYGKMLYLRHSDGYTTTYAHLSAFSSAISARVVREQQRLERFAVGFDCEPNEFPVHKGDLIAYTGDTGTGSAHLHFEIRDEELNPINPLLCTNLHTPDSIPPTFRKVAITPLGPQSTVNGNGQPRVFQAHQIGPRHFHVAGPIDVTGEAGIAVDVRDLSDGTYYKHGVYSHALFLDGRPIYSVELDKIPYRESQQIGLYYDWELLDEGRGRFERLYASTPNGLPFYWPRSEGAGIINSYALPDGAHTFRIVSEDYSGNTSELTGEFTTNHPPQFLVERDGPDLRLTFADPARASRIIVGTRRNGVPSWESHTIRATLSDETRSLLLPVPPRMCDIIRIIAENARGISSPPQFYFVHEPTTVSASMSVDHEIDAGFVSVAVRSSGMFTSPPTAAVYEGIQRSEIPLIAQDINRYVGSFVPIGSFSGPRRVVVEGQVNGRKTSATDEFDMYAISPGTSGNITFDGGGLTLTYDSLSVYGTTFFEIAKDTSTGDACYQLSPRNTILRGGLAATVKRQQALTRGGLFFHGRGGREYIGIPGLDSATTFQGRISRTFGELSVQVDDIPPYVRRLVIARTSGRRPIVTFRYGDNLSGVEYNELKMYIDGKAVIPEIDGEHHRASYKANDPLEHGSHLLSIRLKDKIGNASIVERRFTVQ